MPGLRRSTALLLRAIAVAVASIVIVVALSVGLAVFGFARYLGATNRFVTVPAAFIVALAFVQLIARGMTSPVREMAAAAEAMAHGDYERRVTATSRDEVGELARSFNDMAEQLAQTDRLRRDLIANVSHELRTPLAALQAVLENVIDGVKPASPETHQAMLDQVDRLSRLVAQLLDLSRLEAGQVPLDRQLFPLSTVLHDVAATAKMRRPDCDVRVRIASVPEPRVDGDPERIHQIVVNLVDNAIHHSPSGAPIDVIASQSADTGAVTLEVRDRGPGIPDAEAVRIFERFYRLDAARGRGEGGAGLGLAIVKWIVDLHGGTIRTEPNMIGGTSVGCCMIVSLPGHVQESVCAQG